MERERQVEEGKLQHNALHTEKDDKSGPADNLEHQEALPPLVDNLAVDIQDNLEEDIRVGILAEDMENIRAVLVQEEDAREEV